MWFGLLLKEGHGCILSSFLVTKNYAKKCFLVQLLRSVGEGLLRSSAEQAVHASRSSNLFTAVKRRKAEICHFLPSTQDPSPTQAMCFHHDYQTLISFASLFNPLKVKNMSEETASTLPSLTKFIVSYKNRPSDVAFYFFPIRMRCIHVTPLRKL